jgi:hypothetical protein
MMSFGIIDRGSEQLAIRAALSVSALNCVAVHKEETHAEP